MDIRLTYIGHDFWSMPNYVTDKGTIVVDLADNQACPDLYTKTGNDIDGDPNRSVHAKEGVTLVFIMDKQEEEYEKYQEQKYKHSVKQKGM